MKDSWVSINHGFNTDPEDPDNFEVQKSDIFHALRIIKSRHTKWVQERIKL